MSLHHCLTALRRYGAGIAALICIFTLSGCLRTQTVPRPEVSHEAAALRWQAFDSMADPAPAPSRLEGSLRFGPVNDTTRVSYILWNNGDVPLRMDVMAGGIVGASVEVAGSTVLAYMPRNEKAYIGTDDPTQALAAMGLPLPVSVARLNAFLLGRYKEALGNPAYQSFRPAIEGDGIVYSVQSDLGEWGLELSPAGLPVSIAFPQSWNIALDIDPASGLPTRMDGTLPGGTPHTFRSGGGEDFRFVLMVKNRQETKPFADSELMLNIPQGTPVFDLDTTAARP